MRLVAHVLLAAERPAVRDELDGHACGIDVEHGSDVVAVVPHALPSGVHVEGPLSVVPGRDRHGRLGFEERVLDPLRVERLVDGERTRGEGRVEVGATRVRAGRQHVGVGAPHRQRGVVVERGAGVGVRRVHLVADLDQLGSGAGVVAGVGDDHGEHVARVRRAPTDGDHHRPVLVDQPDTQLAGQVVGGEHGLDPGRGERGRGVDRDDVGSGVVGQVERGVQHPGHPDVVDVAAVAEGQRRRLVLRSSPADVGRQRRRAHGSLGDGLDRVEDLHVAGATTEVGTEMRRHLLAGQRGALLVDLRLGPHHDAGDAEPALEAAARGERVGERLPLGPVHAFERDDRRPLDLVHVALTRNDRLAVDEHGAAPALSRRRAAVLGRGDVELLAQRCQQVRMRAPHCDRRAVDLERDAVVVASGGVGGRVGEFGHALQFVKAQRNSKARPCEPTVTTGVRPAM